MRDKNESRMLKYKNPLKISPDLSIPKMMKSRTSEIVITVALPITFEGITFLSFFEVKIPPSKINKSRPRIITR